MSPSKIPPCRFWLTEPISTQTTQPASTPTTQPVDFPVKLWIWNHLESAPQKQVAIPSAHVISGCQEPWSGPLRIIFAPLEVVEGPHQNAFKNIFEHFKVPQKVELERQRAVNHAVGTHVDIDGQTNVTWFRIVCKNINIVEDGQAGRWKIQGDDISSDRSWFDSSCVLIEKRGQGVTLLFFGVSGSLEKRFDELKPDLRFSEQPWSIVMVVFEALFDEMNTVAWKLANVFRSMEEDTLKTAKRFEDSTAGLFNFPRLHNISKHCIYISEGFEAAKEVIHALMKVMEHEPRLGTGNALQDFRHTAQLFRSSQLRLASLERRISNITNLSFNIFIQRDSRRMGQDSRSMNTIAIMTLIFLPSILIATLFGSNLFDFGLDDKDKKSEVRVSGLFWIFWAISVPLTGLVMILWLIKSRIKQAVDY